MTPSWTNAHQLKNHAALKRKRTEVIKDPCIAADGFTYEEDAIKDTPRDAGLYVEVVWIIRVELLDDFGFSSPSICFAVKIYYLNIDFEYSQLCARNVLPRCSSNSPQPSNSSRFGTTQHPDLDVFEKYSHLYAKSTTTRSPTTSLDTMHTSIVRNAQTIYNESQTQHFFLMKVISCFQISLLHAYALLLVFIFLDRLLWLFTDSSRAGG
ncbi:hypothetical protein Tco_1248548 [Tanacetum coccineum]